MLVFARDTEFYIKKLSKKIKKCLQFILNHDRISKSSGTAKQNNENQKIVEKT